MYKLTGGSTLLDVNLILTKAEVKERMRIADLGCGGSGYFVFPTAIMVGKEGRVFAVDIMRTALQSIERKKRQENISNVETIWSNLEIFNATKIESSSLDMAFLVNTLYQTRKRKEIIQEASRMLKKGSRLVVVDWKNVAAPFGPPIEERVNIENIKEVAAKSGLKFEEEFFAGQFHTGLLFTKA